jgi:hypothetical protein
VLQVPSNNRKGIAGIDRSIRLCFRAKVVSTKQWVEPESTKARNTKFSRRLETSFTNNELGSERAAALSRNVSETRRESTQPSDRAISRGLLTLFSTPWRVSPY